MTAYLKKDPTFASESVRRIAACELLCRGGRKKVL